ncbi:DUF2272 domain-containing protein [Rhizobium johnstonii]|uniref:DUF2272 domain-containing protein n=1 Tax=Rhizobium johnstonii TaxID=3019933 RepID=UPI003F9A5D63
MSDFKSELVRAAQAEKARFGGRDETKEAVKPILTEYWIDGGGRNSRAAEREIRARTAWSAAFISFVVKTALKESESSAAFEFSASHSIYAGAAIRNQLNNVRFPAFYGFPPTGEGAVKPEVGDLIGVTRVKWIDDYADALGAARAGETYYSHFDVVIKNDGNTVETIGGNVSNTVGPKTFRLSNGLLPNLPFRYDSAGRVISGPFICVIKHLTG